MFCLKLKEGIYQCYFALGGSECVDNSQGFANLKVPVERLIPIGIKSNLYFLYIFRLFLAFKLFGLYLKCYTYLRGTLGFSQIVKIVLQITLQTWMDARTMKRLSTNIALIVLLGVDTIVGIGTK